MLHKWSYSRCQLEYNVIKNIYETKRQCVFCKNCNALIWNFSFSFKNLNKSDLTDRKSVEVEGKQMNIQEESGVNGKHSDDINQGLNCEKGY